MGAQQSTERGRGWGPFTGRQLATIIVALIVMLLLPVGAWAASGSNVFVTDSGSGNRATVNGAGALTVSQAPPKKFFVSAQTPNIAVGAGVYTPLATPATQTALVITQINVDIEKITTPGPTFWVKFAISKSDATCNSVVQYHTYTPLARVTPATSGVTTLPFQPGIVVPVGRSLCVAQGDPSVILSEVAAFGYSIPALISPHGA